MTASGGIVVTGASTGIGRACALDLTQRGFLVFAGVRSEQAAEMLRKQAATGLTPLVLDITREDQVRDAVDTVGEALGDKPLLGLVNNAGITVNGPLEFVPLEDLRRQLEVNVVGQVAVTQALLPLLRQGTGRVVLIGSVSGLVAMPGMGPYCMSKFAIEALGDVLRLELSPFGIRVIVVEPGTIETPIWDKGHAEWDEFAEAAPEALHELYGRQNKSVKAIAKHVRSKAHSAQVVADAVADALTAPRPKIRYLVGGQARQQWLLSKLPDSWRDRALRKLMRF